MYWANVIAYFLRCGHRFIIFHIFKGLLILNINFCHSEIRGVREVYETIDYRNNVIAPAKLIPGEIVLTGKEEISALPWRQNHFIGNMDFLSSIFQIYIIFRGTEIYNIYFTFFQLNRFIYFFIKCKFASVFLNFFNRVSNHYIRRFFLGNLLL